MEEQPTWEVKKGRRMVIEIEFLDDVDLHKGSPILKSLYGKEENNPFKDAHFQVTTVSIFSYDQLIADVKKRVLEAIENIK